MQFSTDQLAFPFIQNSHISTSLTIKNITQQPQVYKLKASTANKFIIKPNQGIIRPNQPVSIQIVLHRDAVQNIQNQKVQVLYGKSYDDAQSKFLKLSLIDDQSRRGRLNLTMMVQEKQQRVRNLNTQIDTLRTMPVIKPVKSKSKITSKALITLVVGIIAGIILPIRIF